MFRCTLRGSDHCEERWGPEDGTLTDGGSCRACRREALGRDLRALESIGVDRGRADAIAIATERASDVASAVTRLVDGRAAPKNEAPRV